MRVIRTKYLGPTNTKGARIVADDGCGNKVTIAYRYELSTDACHQLACWSLCNKLNWPRYNKYGWHKDECFFIYVKPEDKEK